MAYREQMLTRLRRTVFSGMALGVIVLSLVLTASFIGLLALLNGVSLDVGSRLPAYALIMGLVFVSGIVRLDTPERDGLTVLVAVSGLSLLAFVLAGLAGEGVAYTMAYPNQMLLSNLILYFGAAGLVCTGVVLWGLHHWREFAQTGPRR